MGTVLSSEVARREHIRVMDEIAEDRFAALELDKLLIYMVDTVDLKALPFLASQFDLLGVKGYKFAKTEQEQRDLIKRAIELHRFKGTPFSIRRALQSIGYAGVIFTEGTGALYDGEFNYDGTIYYGGGNWAQFRATVDLGENKGYTPESNQEVIDVIEEYQPRRSQLMSVDYEVNTSDTETIIEDDTFEVNFLYSEGVDPITESNFLTVEENPVSDNFASLVEGDLTINVLNSLGEQINQYVF